MKVLHLISGGDKGGAKTHVFTLLMALQEDIEVTVLCVMDGVFYQEIKNMPINSVLIEQKYRNDLTIIRPLVKHIRQNRYNLIHSHGARANFIAMFLRPFIKIPIVTTVHSDYRLDFTENLYKKYVYTSLNVIALKFVDYYIAVSNNFKEMLENRSFNKERIYTVYNTIDFDKKVEYLPKKQFLKTYGLTEDTPVVGIIGRFDQVKGHDVFIKAAALVVKKYPEVKFLMAGEGPEENSLKQLVKRLKLTNNIIFTGFVEDIFSFINAIDINVLTSYSESFPYVLLEGALMKKATISTAVGGIVDLIKEEQTGLLAPGGDYETIAEKILFCLNNPQERAKLGESLYSYAKENFSKESMKKTHLEIYNNIISIHKQENRAFDIILSGYYGFENSGDDALLKAVIDSLRKEKKDIKLLVLSKKPGQTMEEHNVYSINRYDFFAIFRALKRSRLFVYGGGSLIQDITSTKSLVYYTLLLKLAKRYNLKLMVYGNGIGPITKKVNRLRAKSALNLCDYISLREPMSLDELNALEVKVENTVLSVDPAFAIEPNFDIEHILEKENIDTDKKYFAVSCRSWKYNEPLFTKKISGIIKETYEKYHIVPLYIPMHPNDNIIIKEIISKAETPHRILSEIYDVSVLMGIMRNTVFVMSMRLHALVYGVKAGIPIIGLVYDPKVRFFVEYASQQTYVDTAKLDICKLREIVEKLMANHEAVSKEIKARALELESLTAKDARAAVELL